LNADLYSIFQAQKRDYSLGKTPFNKAGYAKAAGNIAFIEQSDGVVRVITETRVQCLDHTSRRRFFLYWLLINPFSGIIRKEWQRLIKQKAEKL
jgi:hypothetical protein